MRTLPAGTNGPDGPGYGCGHRAAPGVVGGRLGLSRLDLDRVEERHLGTQPRADALDQVVAVGLPEALEVGPAGVTLRDPLGRERPVLDVLENCLHGAADVVVDDPRPGDVIAVLRGVADREPHEVEAAAVHQVDDELELVHRLEVRELRLVAGVDKRLERHLDERRRAAAEDRLLAEQVGLGLLGEGRLEDAGPCRADRPAVRQDAVAGGPGLVAMDGEQRRNAAAGTVDGPQQMTRSLRARSSRHR